MASFPSSWIITPKESGVAPSSSLRRRASVLSPAFKGPPPSHSRRREHAPRSGSPCECDYGVNHDHIYPLTLREYPPFQKDYPIWPVFSRSAVLSSLQPDRSAPRSQPSATQTQFHCAPIIKSTLHSIPSRAKESLSPPPPHPAPYAHYSTHFPSAWLHSTPHRKRRLSFTSSVDPQDFSVGPRRRLTPQSSSACQLPIRQPTREPTPQQHHQQRAEALAAPHEVAMTDANPNTTTITTTSSRNIADGTARDIMAELKGEPSQELDMGVQIDMWVDRVSSHGSSPSQSIAATTTTKDTSRKLDEKCRPNIMVGSSGGGFDMDVDMDGSDDASGLGDVAHVPRGMLHENYSVYSESTNRVEQGREE